MFVLDHGLVIGSSLFPAVKSVSIESTQESIMDTMTVELPYYKELDADSIQEGMPIQFAAGYKQYGLNTEFSGIIKKITPTQPYTLTCYDYLEPMASEIVSRTFKNTLAGAIVTELCSSSEFILPTQVSLGSMIKYRSYKNKSKLAIMQDLAKTCGYVLFMKGKELVFNSKSALVSAGQPPLYAFGHNVIEDSIERSDNAPYDKLVLTSKMTDGTGLTYRAEMGDGEKIKYIKLYDVEQAELYVRLAELFVEYCTGGYTGEITSFGYPLVHHTEQVLFDDSRYPDKTGLYDVTKTKTQYSASGFRRNLTVVRHAA